MAEVNRPDSSGEVSLITATYNRGDCLTGLHISLCEQGGHVREWIVVDDGSSDNTGEIVRHLSLASPFPIVLITQPNGGKHVAINAAVAVASANFLGIIDSDDLLLPDALGQLLGAWHNLSAPTQRLTLGVTGRCIDDEGVLVGGPGSSVWASWQEAHYVHRLRGERWGIQKRSLLKEVPFPSSESERFVGESVVWRQLGASHRTLYVESPVRVYRKLVSERLTDLDFAIVASARKNSHGSVLRYDFDYFQYSPMQFVKSAIQWSRATIVEGDSVMSGLSTFPLGARLLVISMLPLGWALARRGMHASSGKEAT